MKQRQSLPFPSRPPVFPTDEERLSQSIAIAKYLLTEDKCLTPTLFFNTADFGRVILEGNFENSAISVREETQPPESAVIALESLGTASALVLHFDIGNTVVIAGTTNQYYFVDIFRDICYVTTSPEYDIMAYTEEYGDSEFKCFYLQESGGPVATIVAQQPPAKKKKVAPVKKSEAVATPTVKSAVTPT
jgi:hypothetical protein